MTLEEIEQYTTIVASVVSASSILVAAGHFVYGLKKSAAQRSEEAELTRQTRRISGWRELHRLAAVINSVDTPLSPAVARSSGDYISAFDEKLLPSAAFTNLLYQQLNYLHIAFLNRTFFDPGEFEQFDKWAKYTLNCWIEKVEPLQKIVATIADSEGYGDEFSEYLNRVLVRPFADPRGRPALKERDLFFALRADAKIQR